MHSAAALPSKESSPYAITELKRFIYEVGRTYGHIQSDQENSIISIAKGAIKEIGGLQLRKAPRGSSQSQGSIERFHETLDGQGRYLRIHVEQHYDTIRSAKDPIIHWIIRHSSWLLNRYILHDDVLSSYQRR